jgi:hypothetical protein
LFVEGRSPTARFSADKPRDEVLVESDCDSRLPDRTSRHAHPLINRGVDGNAG